MAETPKPEWAEAPPEPSDEKTNPGTPVTAGYLKRKLKKRSVGDRLMSIASSSVGLGGMAACLLFIDKRVQAQTDAGIKGHEERITTLEQQGHQLRDEVYEARKDMRELQNVIITRKRSERLDEPVAPPAPPPPTKDGGR